MAHMTVCRLCSTTEQIFDVFHPHLNNGEQLRYSILLATGIKIKETDVISKMVCHRCCEIVLKLHKYRTNAVANDKLLKEKACQPYTAPIVDQDELLRAASAILQHTKSLYDSLGLINISIKEESIDASSGKLSENGASSQPSFDSTNVGVDQSDKSQSSTTETNTIAENRTVLCGSDPNDKIVSLDAVSVVQHHSPTLLNVIKTDNSNVVSSGQCRSTPKIKYKHSSVQKLFDLYTNIIIPENAFRSHVSPVISLDSEEVSNWYAEQLRILEQKLPNINIKKLPNASNNAIASSPLTSIENRDKSASETSSKPSTSPSFSTEHSATILSKNSSKPFSSPLTTTEHTTIISSENSLKPSTSPLISTEHNATILSKNSSSPLTSSAIISSEGSSELSCEYSIRKPCPKRHKRKRNYRRIVDSSDSDNDNIGSKKYQPFNSHQKKNDITTKVPLTNQQEPRPLKHVNRDDKYLKKSNSYIRRKAVLLEDDDVIEVIPKKKKRVYDNKHDNFDSPQKCSSDEKERNILSSSLKLTPVQPDLSTNTISETFLCYSCNKLYDTQNELRNHEKIHLRCKFCKKKLKNLESLNKHQNETCFVNIIKNQPSIELRKVDSIPTVVKKYRKAFQEPDVEKPIVPVLNSNCNEYIDYSELGLNIEKAVSPIPPNELFIELEESLANQYFTLLEDFEKNNYNSDKKLVTENNKNSQEVICISDGSDNEDCWNSVNKTITSPSHLDKQLHGTSSQLCKPKLNFPFSFPSNLSEKEVINSMFKKHYSKYLKKCENGSQTLIGCDRNIKSLSTNNGIKLYNVVNELFNYKIPVQLKPHPTVSVEFKMASVLETPTLNYCWGHKKAIYLEKLANKNPIVPSRLPNNPCVPTNAILNSTPSYCESAMLNKPSSNRAFSSPKFTNARYTAPPPIHNFNNGLTDTLRGTPYSNVQHNKPITFKQSVAMPNTAAVIPSNNYRMPITPENKTSVALENSQDNVFYDQPEQLFYNNQNVNVNNYFMFSNDSQSTQQQTSSINSGNSCLSNVYTIPLPSYEMHLQKGNLETINQNINLVPSPANVQYVRNPSGTLRVKQIQELS